jgi:hypothetical protein
MIGRREFITIVKRKQQWHACAKSPPQCEFPLSRNGNHFADLTTSQG